MKRRVFWNVLLFLVFLLSIASTEMVYAEQKVKKFNLYATDGYLQLPDGEQVYIWGYSLENKKGTAVYPAPTLRVQEGDLVEVTLTNIGAQKEGIKRLAHTIHWHGLDTDQENDGVPETSPAIQVGEQFTYRFTATHAGTYFYHCHVDTIEHLQMGMHGTLIVEAKDGKKQAWTNGPIFDKEYVFHLNEIDPVWHKAVEEGKPYDRTSFHPRYWTINGKAFPDTMKDPSTMVEGKVGETILIRLINAGYEEHPFHMHGHHFKVIATDGRPLPAPVEKDTINIGAGERYDILVTFTQTGSYPFHSHKITDNTNNGIYPGGMHTMTKISNIQEKTIQLKAGDPKVLVDGQTIILEVAPVLQKSTTYVPLRFIGNQFGAGIEWIPEERSVIYTTESVSIQLWIDQKRVLLNGKEITLETPPIIIKGTSMVPLRFVTENLGATIDYDPTTALITIHYGANTNPVDDQMHDSQGHPTDTTASNNKTTIDILNSSFSKKEIQIKKGTTLTWVNKDTQIHTVTELNNNFDSGNLLPNQSWSYTFEETGTYIYYCATHPSMEAKVIVE